MPEDRPTWQASRCPRWCTRSHQEKDVGGDRNHATAGIFVPVIRLTASPLGEHPQNELVADEVVVVAFQGQEDQHPSISIGLTEDASITLNLRAESALRVSEALQQVLSVL